MSGSISMVGVMAAALLMATAAVAAERSPHLERGRQLLSELEDEAALVVLEEGLRSRGNSSEQLAELYLYLGVAQFNLGNESAALASFQTARVLHPQVSLPEWISPRINALWEKATEAPSTERPGPLKLSLPTASAAGPEPELSATQSAPPPGSRWKRWTGAGAALTGAALLVGGILNGLQHGALLREVESEASVGGARRSYESAERAGTRANLFFVSGALAMTGGGLLLVLDLGE